MFERPDRAFRHVLTCTFVVLALCWTAGVFSCQPASSPVDGGEHLPEKAPEKIASLPIPSKPTDCKAGDLEEPHKLVDCDKGNGLFGFWKLDPAGLPSYEYTFPHLDDPRATYKHSSIEDPRHHTHLVGNSRINAIAYNDGYLELFGQERGATFMNRMDAEQQNYAGGYSIIGEGGKAWNTAYRWRPEGAQTRRVFGVGYARMITQHDGLRVTRDLIAPPGDAPFVIDQVEIQNLSSSPRKIRHYEYWDVNRHQAMFQPLRAGVTAKAGDKSRDALNKAFEQQLTFQVDLLKAVFVLREPAGKPSRDEPSNVDYYPAPLFLASLTRTPDGIHTEQAQFLGKGGIKVPDAARLGSKGGLIQKHDAFGQPAALIMEHQLEIPANGAVKLRFAFGYVPKGKQLDEMIKPWKAPGKEPLQALSKSWEDRLPYFSTPSLPVISREVPWHGAALLAATNVLEYYDTPVTPQGSTYLYLHGLDGAPRDQALFSLPLVYLEPALARANLRLVMGLTNRKDGSIGYSFHGFGIVEGATIHTHPSDLDLFFMIALNEYLSATGDASYLQQKVPFYPRSSTALPPGAKGETVLDHLRAAVTHLIDFVQRGPNGLIRIWDGDWSDGIVWENPKEVDSEKTIDFGESIPNTQMAVYILPLLANRIEHVDPVLARQMRDYAKTLLEPLRKQWTGKWFLRAWMRDRGNTHFPVGKDKIDLESQPWGLIAQDLLTTTQQKTLMTQVYDLLDKNSKVGPTLKSGGMVWPAISQLMTWAYSRDRPELAWRSLQNHMYASHAQAFPGVWFGIWSGPDGIHSKSGTTWGSIATPMTDWPVMNMNQDAMFLLGTLRVAGIEPSPKGLRIRPGGSPETFSLKTKLIELKVKKYEASGVYHAQNSGSIELVLMPPPGKTLDKVSLQGKQISPAQGGGSASLPMSFKKGESRSFSFTWKD